MATQAAGEEKIEGLLVSPVAKCSVSMHAHPAREVFNGGRQRAESLFVVAPGRAFNPNSLPRFLPFDWPRSRPRQRQMAWRDHSRAGVGHS